MSERERHIFVLEDMLILKNLLAIEQLEAIQYAIDSLKTDEAYQLEYEHIPYITLNELKEIREEIGGLQTYKLFSGDTELYLSKDDVKAILDKKISEMEVEDEKRALDRT